MSRCGCDGCVENQDEGMYNQVVWNRAAVVARRDGWSDAELAFRTRFLQKMELKDVSGVYYLVSEILPVDLYDAASKKGLGTVLSPDAEPEQKMLAVISVEENFKFLQEN